MTYMADFLMWIENLGFTDVILPLTLIFIITYLILEKVHFFGDDDKSRVIRVIISIVMALAFVIPHISPELGYPDFVPKMNLLIGQVSIFTLIVFFFFIVIATFSLTWDPNSGAPIDKVFKYGFWVALIVFIFFLLHDFNVISGSNLNIPGLNINLSGIFANSDLINILIGLIMFGAVIWAVAFSGKGQQGTSGGGQGSNGGGQGSSSGNP